MIIVAKLLFNISDFITEHTSIIKKIPLFHDLIRQGKLYSNDKKQKTGYHRKCSLDKLTISHKYTATASMISINVILLICYLLSTA